MVVTFSITYLSHRGVDTTRILTLLFFAHIIHAFIIPAVGHATDRFGRRPLYIAGALLTMVWPFAAFPMLDTGTTGIVLAAIITGMMVHSLMYAAQPAIMTEMFPTRMRYSGVSLGYQLTAIIAGSWAPLIGTALLREYETWWPIAVYIMFAGAVSLIAALVMRETKGASLVAIDREDAARN